MLFSELIKCNKDWNEATQLIVFFKDSYDPCPVSVFDAYSKYGDCKVLSFRSWVVVIE